MTVRILVADDSITIQKIVAMAFENEDAEVEGIGDGQKAFDRIPEFKPDIVLADVDMPGLNGFQLCKKIKGASDLKNIKVMLLASDFECFDEELFKNHLLALRDLMDRGEINPIIDSTWRYEKVSEAQKYMHQGKNRGKILLDFHHSRVLLDELHHTPDISIRLFWPL